MIIKVDVREQELLKHMKYFRDTGIPSFKDLQITSENLPIGDIILSDEKDDKIVIERKSVSDLMASIKDGRYEEQSYRLNGLPIHNHNIYYIIEGDVTKYNSFKDGHSKKLTIYSAIFSLNYYKGFSVMRTFTIEETAMFICNIANKLSRCEKSIKMPFYTNIQSNIQSNIETLDTNGPDTNASEEISDEHNQAPIYTDKSYVNVIKKVKKENITPSNIGEIMLSQIPGVSSLTAITIMEKYKSIDTLLQELKNNPTCLNNLTQQNKGGQSRKISKTSISNIHLYLLNT
jgi:ERCC4-type nuclease